MGEYGYGLSYTGPNRGYEEEFEPEEVYYGRLGVKFKDIDEFKNLLRHEPFQNTPLTADQAYGRVYVK